VTAGTIPQSPLVGFDMVTQSVANDVAVDIFASFDSKAIALLLDVDGRLIDIGLSPFEVDVSDELRGAAPVPRGDLQGVGGEPVTGRSASRKRWNVRLRRPERWPRCARPMTFPLIQVTADTSGAVYGKIRLSHPRLPR